MTTFLLVHGAWHGAWCWERLVPLLEARGYPTIVPCLPGLGERADELTADVDLSRHAAEVAERVLAHEGGPLVAVAHSYAGAVLQLACESVADRLAGRVFLDASILADGEKVMDLVPPELAAQRIREAKARDGVAAMPPPPGRAFGLHDADDIAYLESRLTPHPLATYLETVRLRRAPDAPPASVYVTCTDPIYEPLASSRQKARDHGWKQLELASGHDAMVRDPERTVDVLMHASELIGGEP